LKWNAQYFAASTIVNELLLSGTGCDVLSLSGKEHERRVARLNYLN